MDTASIDLMATQPDYHVVQSDLDEMLQYLTGGGITMVNGCHPHITAMAKPFSADLL
jgi:hypothetical protein